MFLLCFASQMLVYDLPLATFAISSSSDTDKLALLALKEKLTNGVSDSLPSWNESLHFCEWQGITCDHPHMRVAFGKPNIGWYYWAIIGKSNLSQSAHTCTRRLA